MKLLFVGDSTTDMGRSRVNNNPYALGTGHVFMIAEELMNKDPNIEIINRGNSGDRVTNINDRFQIDVLDIKADVVTIMFGVNDVWHALAGTSKLISLKKWTEYYQSFIDRIKKQRKDTRIILMTPFYLHGTATDGMYDKFSILKRYQKRVKKLAMDNKLEFIDTQKALTKLGEKIGDSHVLYDGVHPDVCGAKEIARIWLKKYKQIQR